MSWCQQSFHSGLNPYPYCILDSLIQRSEIMFQVGRVTKLVCVIVNIEFNITSKPFNICFDASDLNCEVIDFPRTADCTLPHSAHKLFHNSFLSLWGSTCSVQPGPTIPNIGRFSLPSYNIWRSSRALWTLWSDAKDEVSQPSDLQSWLYPYHPTL